MRVQFSDLPMAVIRKFNEVKRNEIPNLLKGRPYSAFGPVEEVKD